MARKPTGPKTAPPAAPGSALKLAIIEDQLMFRALLRKLLTEQCGATVALECGSLAEVRAKMDVLKSVDLVLLDIRLPDGDGIAFAEELSKRKTGAGVLLMSSSSEDFVLHRVNRSFVQGFVHKEDPPEVLVTAVQVAASGASYFSPRYRAKLLALAGREDTFEKLLSPREQDVLRLLAMGHTDSQAASALGTSTSTVESHRRNIMMKLRLHNSQEMQTFALKAGFITVNELQD